MSLEFTRLAQLTGEHKYFDVVHRTTEFFDTGYNEIAHPKGLLPTQLSDTSKHLRGQYSMGGMGEAAHCGYMRSLIARNEADSYYEYLIKEHQLLAGSRSEYSRMFSEALDSAYVHLMADVQVVPGQQLLVIGENNWDRFTPTLTHLVWLRCSFQGLASDRCLDLLFRRHVWSGQQAARPDRRPR
jgi:mannosyl-oligosaccharide alpha-1,2-mannosidase